MKLDQKGVGQHVPILGWLYIVSNAIFLLIGGLVFFFLVGIGVATGDGEAAAILGVTGVFVMGIMMLFAVPGVVAGYGLLKGKNWGRILALIVAAFSLLNFPIGTAISLYTFWVLLQEDANVYFTLPKAI